jgi:uncharacterized RDD family membrane protein YckC
MAASIFGISLASRPRSWWGSNCHSPASAAAAWPGFALFMLALLLITLLPAVQAVKHSASSSIDPAKWAVALLIFVPFLLQWGYFTLFEAFWNGQTPGKKVLHLRVIQKSGRPIGLFESMTRNLIRIIDMVPGFYAVGAACIFATRRQQRLGDMVAGTLVVHSIPVEKPMLPDGTRTFTAAAFEPVFRPVPVNPLSLPADAVARLSSGDLQLLENFLVRRLDLPIEVRTKLAARLAQTMAGKMTLDIPLETSDETFLEGLVLAMRETGGNPVA